MYSSVPKSCSVLSTACSPAIPWPGRRALAGKAGRRLLGYVARTAITAALLVLGTAGTLQAQQPSGSEALLPAAIPLPLLDSLSLTTEQRTRITADLETRRQTLDAILDRVRASGGASDTDRSELRAFVDDRNAAIRAALTADQRTKLDQLLARRE